MPTPKQEKLATELIKNQLEDKPKALGAILESVGYSPSVATTYPGAVIASPGVQEALAEAQEKMVDALRAKGIDPAEIASSIKKLLHAKKIIKMISKDQTGNVVKVDIVSEEENVYAIDKGISHALKVGVGGGYLEAKEPTTSPNINIQVINSPQVQNIVQSFEAQLKQALTSKPNVGSSPTP